MISNYFFPQIGKKQSTALSIPILDDRVHKTIPYHTRQDKVTPVPDNRGIIEITDQPFEYTVRFQNTGNDTAYCNIRSLEKIDINTSNYGRFDEIGMWLLNQFYPKGGGNTEGKGRIHRHNRAPKDTKGGGKAPPKGRQKNRAVDSFLLINTLY
ncbi:MAG: hypothetical protein IPN93_02580 [Bacteroidetes bacterium]|nr:hypothetical protein [Bacteroidota bacterium]